MLGQLVSAGRYSHFVLAGHSSVTSRVERELPKWLREKLVDTVPVSGAAPLSDVVEATLVSFTESEEQQSRATVADLLHELRTGGLAVVGAEASVRALHRGQADTLVLAKEYQLGTAWACDHCGAIDNGSLSPDTCQTCGETSCRQSDVRELMVRKAEKLDCPVEIVSQSDELMHVGGVGCLLSYRLPGDCT